MITTRKYGEQSEQVFEDGRHIGDISGSGDRWLIDPVGARYGTYWFVGRQDALDAVVHYSIHKHWHNEVVSASSGLR